METNHVNHYLIEMVTGIRKDPQLIAELVLKLKEVLTCSLSRGSFPWNALVSHWENTSPEMISWISTSDLNMDLESSNKLLSSLGEFVDSLRCMQDRYSVPEL